jgi:hypothetical protein
MIPPKSLAKKSLLTPKYRTPGRFRDAQEESI